MYSEVIGLSQQNRPLAVQYLGSDEAAVRVMFICGQHGDERAIRKGMRHFIEQRGLDLEQAMPLLRLAVLCDANPDGYAARTRANAQGIDLNRDHVRLEAPETRAIHEFIRRWQPHLVVDFHNYPARRKHLVDQRLRLGWDVCLDIPTNPAIGCNANEVPLAGLFDALAGVARRQGFHFGRYGLYGSDGSFRHGTPQLGDARNTITLRYETPALLVEVRNPSRSDVPEDRHILRSAVASTVWEICGWAMRETGYLWEFNLAVKQGTRIPMGFKRRAGTGVAVPVRDTVSGASGVLGPTRDRCRVDARRHRVLPASYRVTQETLQLLARQGYQLSPPRDGQLDWQVTVEQRGGRMLALLLDAQSRYRVCEARENEESCCLG